MTGMPNSVFFAGSGKNHTTIMGRQRKKIHTRRERFRRTMRHTRLILLFAFIALLLLAWFRRHKIWDQLYPYFY